MQKVYSHSCEIIMFIKDVVSGCSHEVSDVAGLASFSFGQDEVDRYVMLWKKVRNLIQATLK